MKTCLAMRRFLISRHPCNRQEIYEFDDDFTQVRGACLHVCERVSDIAHRLLFLRAWQYGGCSVTTAVSSGTYKYWLFDLDSDPEEKTNLYGLSDAYVAIQVRVAGPPGNTPLASHPDTSTPPCLHQVRVAVDAASVW